MNSINFFHEFWHMTHKNQLYKILYESRLIFHKSAKKLKLPVIFSIFMKNQKMKIHNIFIELFLWMLNFMSLDSWNESRLTFLKIHKNILWAFIKLTPGITGTCLRNSRKNNTAFQSHIWEISENRKSVK